VGSLVYASTWEVYGKPETDIVDESHQCNPESSYSISKLAGEFFVRQLRSLMNVKATALRLGTAYGPGMRSSAVISRFLDRARKGEPLTIFGNGRQFRQFTHTADIARAFVLCLKSDPKSGVYNIVADEKISIRDLAGRIARVFKVPIEVREQRASEPPSAHVSSKLAQKELGWVSQV